MYNKKYLFGLFLAILILAINQIFIQYQLSALKDDASVINIAGRQRMISQRISLQFYKLAQNDSDEVLLKDLYTTWKQSHNLLAKADLVKDAGSSNDINKKLTRLSDRIALIDRYIHEDSSSIASNLLVISHNQDSFLNEMDGLVNSLEQYSASKVSRLRIIEIVLFLMSVLLIVLELFLIFRPIQQKLKTKNEELEKLNESLTRKNEQLRDFSFVTSHHLREPLVTMSAYTTLLKANHSDQLDNVGQRCVQFINEASKRMSHQINSLLEYATLGKESKAEEVDTSTLLNEVLMDLDQQISASKAVITKDDFPVLKVFPVEFRILWKNLLSNAIKFRNEGAIPVIEIRYTKKDGLHHFSIKDNGIGILEEYHKKVFYVFQRLNDRLRYEGIGIGLAQCKKIVKLHNGQMRVESEFGKGSTFIFTLNLE